jgi:cell wall-associated NlpC family hydrolase
MTGKTIALLTATILVVVIGCVAGLGLAGGGIAMAACAAPAPTPSGTPSPPPNGWTATTDWTSEQLANAATIVAVGQRLHIPPRGWVIAVATAIQESNLRNLGNLGPNNDHDSLGLFQQRPSQGWGTPAQILDPTYAATQFYTHLTQIPGWQNMPLTIAAQTVQRSAYPDAYAKWEPDAYTLVGYVGSTLTGIIAADFGQWLAICTALGGDGQHGADSLTLPTGFTLPPTTPPAVVTAIWWALRQLGTPYSFGGDCTNAHSTNPAHQCDCSSLTMMAYKNAGITIPRTAAEQSHAGRPVADVAHLLPGDLIFIPGSDGTATAPGHVGLYIGHNLIVQAPHTGDYVKISALSGWVSDIVHIGRVV